MSAIVITAPLFTPLAPCPFCGRTKFLRPAFRTGGSIKGVSCWGSERVEWQPGAGEESCWYFGPSEGARTEAQATALWNNRGAPPTGRHGPWCKDDRDNRTCKGCLDGLPKQPARTPETP